MEAEIVSRVVCSLNGEFFLHTVVGDFIGFTRATAYSASEITKFENQGYWTSAPHPEPKIISALMTKWTTHSLS